MITQDALKDTLSYNPSTGEFIWKKTGRVAGTQCGYVFIQIDKKRLAWLYVYGEIESKSERQEDSYSVYTPPLIAPGASIAKTFS